MAQPKATSATTEQAKSVELDAALAKLTEWQEAAAEARVATARADKLKAEFIAYLRIVGANEGTLRGRRVLSYKPTETFREADFREKRPDLVEHYEIQVTKTAIDWDRLRRDLPKVCDEFRTRAMRPDWKALDTALSLSVDER